MPKQLQSRLDAAANRPQSGTVQVALGLVFAIVQFALALSGFWLLFGLFSAGLVGMPTLALINRGKWTAVVTTVDAGPDARRLRQSWTLVAACSFTGTTILALALALVL